MAVTIMIATGNEGSSMLGFFGWYAVWGKVWKDLVMRFSACLRISCMGVSASSCMVRSSCLM